MKQDALFDNLTGELFSDITPTNEEMTEAQARAEVLRRDLEKWNYEYYVLDNPSVPDSEYDKAFRELSDIEAKYPSLKTPNSPAWCWKRHIAPGRGMC